MVECISDAPTRCIRKRAVSSDSERSLVSKDKVGVLDEEWHAVMRRSAVVGGRSSDLLILVYVLQGICIWKQSIRTHECSSDAHVRLIRWARTFRT